MILFVFVTLLLVLNKYNLRIYYFKYIHREKAPSNKTPALTKSMNLTFR